MSLPYLRSLLGDRVLIYRGICLVISSAPGPDKHTLDFGRSLKSTDSHCDSLEPFYSQNCRAGLKTTFVRASQKTLYWIQAIDALQG